METRYRLDAMLVLLERDRWEGRPSKPTPTPNEANPHTKLFSHLNPHHSPSGNRI